MFKPKGRIAVLSILFALLVGAIMYLSADYQSESEQSTPTPIPTMSDTIAEPSIADEAMQNPDEQVNDDDGIMLSEVAEHSSFVDCWMVIEGKVYDVTDFISEHPGGETIVAGCGTDATEIFNDRPDDGGPHSGFAQALLQQYFIGELVE